MLRPTSGFSQLPSVLFLFYFFLCACLCVWERDFDHGSHDKSLTLGCFEAHIALSSPAYDSGGGDYLNSASPAL